MRTLLVSAGVLLAIATPVTGQRDIGKRAVEGPLKNSLSQHLGAPRLRISKYKVQPGLVRWHASFDAAKAAAAKSGKPVMLFQLLGKLDDEFC